MSLSANFPAIRPSLLLDFANTKALDPRITFTRNTTATYYDGVTTAKAEENLSPYSDQFDNAFWVKVNSTITANATTAPDGTASADSFVVTASGALTSITSSSSNNVGVSGQPLTISIYAKADTATVIQLSPSTAILSAGYANFDLSGGTVGNIGGTGLTAAIVSVGSGWYRCSITIASASGSGGYVVAIVDSTTSARQSVYTGSAGNAVYIWGIQAEQRSAVTAYTATTTQPITNYIPVLRTAAANVARFDHNPTTDESLGLLIEEQRTNVALYSEQFDNASWVKTAVTVTANSNVAPDGTVSADTLVEDTTLASHVISASSFTFAATTAYTASVFVKQAGRSWAFIQLSTTPFGATTRAWFDLANGVVGTQANCTGSIKAVGNGWYRCSVTATTTAGGVGNPPFTVQMATADNTTTYTGNGFSGIFIWGAQLEAGAFATSYIPTVATTVQRNADSASMTGTNFSSWYSQSQGAFYAEGVGAQYTAANAFLSVSDAGSAANTMYFRYAGSGVKSNAIVRANGVTVADVYSTPSTSGNKKAAFAYAVNDFAQTSNGDVVSGTSIDSAGNVPLVNQFNIGTSYPSTPETINGTIKKIAYYPIRVTNAQLQALTS